MKIGLVIAVENELKAFLGSNFEVEIINNSFSDVYHAKINNNDLYAVKSGAGKIDASAATQLLISFFECEKILNFGVTGALERSLQVSDLFVAKSAVNYDFDTSAIDPVKKCQYMEFDDIYMPLSGSLINLAKEIRPDLKDAVVATGDAFVVDQEQKTYLNSLGCNICDMELASIVRVCFLNKIECLSIKCISDAYDGDGSDFIKNVHASSVKAFKLIEELLYKL